jgi:isopentenyl diphosphate isomerase/L-lactate dehydrogenase-like FMN-dependent dehydrogenase
MLINNLTKLNRSSRKGVFAALAVIGAIAIYNWTVAPYTACLLAAQRYESAVGKIAEKNKVINKAVEVRKRKLQELREQSTQLQNTLFAPDKAREFFSDLQVIAQQGGCTVNSLKVIDRERSDKDKQSEIAMDVVAKSVVLNVLGAYENIIKLIEKLQTRTQKVWIDSINMRTPDDGSDYPVCEITITVYTIEEKETGS